MHLTIMARQFHLFGESTVHLHILRRFYPCTAAIISLSEKHEIENSSFLSAHHPN